MAQFPHLEELWINYQTGKKVEVTFIEPGSEDVGSEVGGTELSLVRIVQKENREVLYESATTKTKLNFTAIQQF